MRTFLSSALISVGIIFSLNTAYAATIDDLNQQLDLLNQEAHSLGLEITNAQKVNQIEYTKSKLISDIMSLRTKVVDIRKLVSEAPTKPVLKGSAASCGGIVNLSYEASSGSVIKYVLNRNPDSDNLAQWGRIAESPDISGLPKREMNKTNTSYIYVLRAYGKGDVEIRSDILEINTPGSCSTSMTEVSPYASIIFTPDHGPAGTLVTLYWRGASQDIDNTIELKSYKDTLDLNVRSNDGISLVFPIPTDAEGGDYEIFVRNSRNKSTIGKVFSVDQGFQVSAAKKPAGRAASFVNMVSGAIEKVANNVLDRINPLSPSLPAQCSNAKHVITVGGIDSSLNHPMFASIGEISLGATPISIAGKSIEQNALNIKNAIQMELDSGHSVLVVAHSLGAVISYNLRDKFKDKPVEFIYIDPPYNNLGVKLDPLGFSSVANEIKKSRNNGIEYDPNVVNWTDGSGSGKNHDPWTYPDYKNNKQKLKDLRKKIEEKKCFPPVEPPVKTPTPTPTVSPSFSPTPTSSPSRNPTPIPSLSVSPSVSASPSATVSASPSSSPSFSPSNSPSPSSSVTSSPSVSASPSASVSSSPSASPTSSTSVYPSSSPSVSVSSSPSSSPSGSPMSQSGRNMNFIASVFYSIGDFLDEFIRF